MRLTRRTLLGAVAGTASLAGCTGGDGGSDSGQTTVPETASPMPTESPTPAGGETTTGESMTTSGGEMDAPTVRVSDHPDLDEILVGPTGRTLYMFDNDTRGAGESSCADDCADAWPPLTVEGSPRAGDGVTAGLSAFERDDGSRQVAAGGWPLYYFASDDAPGDATGQGVGGVWWVLRPDGTPVRPDDMGTETETETDTPTPTPEPTVRVRSHPEHGEILTGPDGMTLYMFDSDTNGAGESACADACAEAWPPLAVTGSPSKADGVKATLSTFERDDGSRQVAAAGWPLYYYYRDESPGQARGQAVGSNWWVLSPDGTPIKPDESSAGGSGY